MAKAPKENVKLIANNKKAYHDYFIEDKYEAGISLAGTEVKSLRQGKCSIKESFIRIEKGEVFLLHTGQLSNALAEFDEIVKANGMTLGKDVGLISYNDVPLNAVVLGGLTTISTDFVQMGKLAAEMILSGKMEKIHNRFRMTRRRTF